MPGTRSFGLVTHDFWKQHYPAMQKSSIQGLVFFFPVAARSHNVTQAHLNLQFFCFLGVSLFQVIIPVLANEKNHLGWPHMVCQDIRYHAYSLQCDLLVILEHMKGRTLLPLPVGSEKVEFMDGHGEPV